MFRSIARLRGFSLAIAVSMSALHCGPGATGGPGDLGFRPSPNGFSFENYGNEDGITNLTSVEMRRMFGDQVCASMAGASEGGCTLSPPAERWMNETNNGMNGGHCHGFSLFSLLAYNNRINVNDFGGPNTFALQRSNPRVQREIAYWMATQFSANKSLWLTQLTPSEVVERLRTSLTNRQEIYSIGFFKRGGGGGHAVTPFAVRGEGANTRIMVYDNNFPNTERAIEVDTAANTWRYVASTIPTEPAGQYDGDAMTRSLILIPLSSAMGQQMCSFCGDMPMPGSPEMMEAPREVTTEGGGSVQIEDMSGHMVGTGESGETVNNFPGAEAQEYLSGDLWRDAHEPRYRIPGGTPLRITLSGQLLQQASANGSLSIVGRGFEYAVLNVGLEQNQRDTIELTAGNDAMIYRTQGMETPIIATGFSTPGADYAFGIRVRGDGAGQALGFQMHAAQSMLDVVVNDNDGTTFDVVMIRIDPGQEPKVLTHSNLSANGPVAFRLHFAEWTTDGMGLPVEVDLGFDGTIDETTTITDTNEPMMMDF